MCGIAGLIGKPTTQNREALKRMNLALAHRGPDGEGCWESTPSDSGWVTMLAHRRLSILDLSSAAAQPMIDAVTGDVIVLNGEIYNFYDIRDRLEARGERFQST